jgi:hypothetical protein
LVSILPNASRFDTCIELTVSAAWNICVTIPVVFFFFKETKQVSLEDIDLLFGERALGTLPDDLHKGPVDEIVPTPATSDLETAPEPKTTSASKLGPIREAAPETAPVETAETEPKV